MSVRISNSLISAVDWYLTAPNTAHNKKEGETWKSDALNQLKSLIFKMPFIESEEMKHGLVFEEFLYKCALNNKRGKTELFNKVLNNIIGAQYQKWMKQLRFGVTYDMKGYNIVMSGKIDVLKEDKIIDIKTTNSFNKDKYTNSWQHIIYCIGTGLLNFEYHVITWGKYPTIKSYDIVPFNCNKDDLYYIYKPMLEKKIEECLAVIDQLGYLKEYLSGFYCI